MTTLTDKLLAKPWYREPWPWLLMTGPGVVIIAGFYTLWLAIESDDGLVADDYYKRGLAINQTLSRATRAEQLALGARAEWRADLARVRVTLTGTGVLPEKLRLRLVHPTQAVADQMIELTAVAPRRLRRDAGGCDCRQARHDAGGHGANVAPRGRSDGRRASRGTDAAIGECRASGRTDRR